MPYKRPESRLIYEYMINRYSRFPQWRRVRVGPIPGKEPKELYGVLRRWVDGIVFTGSKIILIEAKMKPDPAAIGQLLFYKKMFPLTPEFEMYKDYPIEMEFVTTREDPMVKAQCKDNGIRYVVYRPKWVEEWEKEQAERYRE